MNFGDLKTELGDWVEMGNTRLPDAKRGKMINWAIRRVGRRYDLRYCEITDTLALVISDRDYALPVRWKKFESLWYTHPTSTGIVFLVGPLTREQFDLNFPDATKLDLPEAYMVWGSNLFVGKTPDQSLTLNRNYYQYLPDLVGVSDTNGIIDDHEDLVLFTVLANASRFAIEDGRIPMWKEELKELEMDFAVEHIRSRSNDRAQAVEPG